MKIIFVTSNQHKLKEAQMILSNFTVRQKKIDITEIQGEIKEIIIHKTTTAFNVLNNACFVEDTSLCFDEWGNLPGPYIKPFLKEIGPEGLYKSLTGFENKKAYAIASIGYLDPKLQKPLVFQGIMEGQITSPKGSSGFEWDQIFIPEGYDKTLAELGMEIKNKISHRKKALKKLSDYLSTNKV